MRLRALTNAGVVIETDDCRIVIDPWLTEPLFYGAWFQYPPNLGLRDRVAALGPIDYIVLSHAHSDHANPADIKWLLERNPQAKVLICRQANNILGRMLAREGINHIQTNSWGRGETEIGIRATAQYRDDIDSVICVRWRNQSIVHWNDVGYIPDLASWAWEWCDGTRTVALLPYSGASDYPQQYFDLDDPELAIAAERKRDFGLAKFHALKAALKPKVAIPCAGSYVLGGRNLMLNQWRGMADAAELHNGLDVFCLQDGIGEFDLNPLSFLNARTKPYSSHDVITYAAALKDRLYDYETDAAVDPQSLLPLLGKAYACAIERSEVTADHWFYLRMPRGEWWVCNANRNNSGSLYSVSPSLAPRHEITLDVRALYGMLIGRYHWNALAGASHAMIRRRPDVYDRATNDFLNGFHV